MCSAWYRYTNLNFSIKQHVLDMRLAYSRLIIHLELEGILVGMLDPGDDQGGGEGLGQHGRVRLAGDTAAGVERRRLTELTVTQHIQNNYMGY